MKMLWSPCFLFAGWCYCHRCWLFSVAAGDGHNDDDDHDADDHDHDADDHEHDDGDERDHFWRCYKWIKSVFAMRCNHCSNSIDQPKPSINIQ